MLAVAREVFLERGPTVSTTEIAKRVGLSQPTLFQRFGDKSSLFLKAVTPGQLDIDAVIGPGEAVATTDVGPHLEALALRLLDSVSEVLRALQLIGQNRDLQSEAVLAAHEEPGIETLLQALRTHLAGITGVEDPDRLMDSLLLLVHGAAFMMSFAPPSEHDEIREKLGKSARYLAV